MAVLEVHDLGIRFGGLQALEAVTFKAEEYEIIGLMGPNGAGKTTAFNCITGFYEPSTGTISYRGRDITSLAPQKASLMPEKLLNRISDQELADLLAFLER